MVICWDIRRLIFSRVINSWWNSKHLVLIVVIGTFCLFYGNMNRSTTILILDLSHRCTSMLLHRYTTILSQSTKQWTSKFRFSFHHRKAIVCHSRIVEDEANKTVDSVVSPCFKIVSPTTSSSCEYQASDFKLSWYTNGISNYVTLTLFVANSTAH